MPSGPQRLYQFLTDAELATLRATIISQMTSGRFTALSGAQKSSSQEWLSLQDQLLAFNLETNIRNGVHRPQKVTQILSGQCLYDDDGYTLN